MWNLLYTNLWACLCLFAWDKSLDFSQRISLLNRGIGQEYVTLPNWQMRLSGVKACAQVHTSCMSAIKPESLVFAPRLWAFPYCSACLRRVGPAGRRPQKDPTSGWSKPQRAWEPSRLVLPSPCSGLPLEAKSRFYTSLALPSCYCSWTFSTRVEVHDCLTAWSRRWAASKALLSNEEVVELRSSMLKWWSH